MNYTNEKTNHHHHCSHIINTNIKYLLEWIIKIHFPLYIIIVFVSLFSRVCVCLCYIIIIDTEDFDTQGKNNKRTPHRRKKKTIDRLWSNNSRFFRRRWSWSSYFRLEKKRFVVVLVVFSLIKFNYLFFFVLHHHCENGERERINILFTT